MTQIDPITLEVVRGYMVSTVLQMRATMIRTSYAPILYECKDFSCGMVTSDGELAAMSEDFAGHVFAMSLGLKAVLEKFKDDVHPGDVLAVNDPYTGGTHLNDIAFYLPFFVEGKPLLYIAVRAHHSDVGGATPGSFSGQDTEIYQEGMRIVPVKLFERGEVNQALWDVLFANMRLPDERQGDALAMLDTIRVAEMAMAELCEKYGPKMVEDCLSALMDSAEETMREQIARLPDGEFYFEHYMDNSGLSPEPLPLKVKLTIEGDSMTFDFTGTAPQAVGPMNCGIPVTQGGVFVVIKSWLDAKMPVNGGTFRPLKFVIPEGSCLASELPAPVGGCWEIFRHLQAMVVGLFSQFIPDDLGAEYRGSVDHLYVGGYDQVRGRYYILYESPQGGAPATSDTDGATGCFNYDAGDLAMVQQAESVEQRQPLIIESLSARQDGEGAGYRRSGFGVARRVRILADSSQLSTTVDGAVIPPWGPAGAPPGSVNSVTVIRRGEEFIPAPIPGKIKGFQLLNGDVVVALGSAGGGVGDALDRETELVRRDVYEGYVSAERARDVYGVAIENNEVDLEKTRRLREGIKGKRQYFTISDGADEFDGRGCRVGLIGATDAAGIGVSNGDMFEYVTTSTAPLRAWATIVDGQSEGTLPLGPIGRGILKIEAGAKVWARRLPIASAQA